MKTKDIEIGQSYTDKNVSSIRKVVSIDGDSLTYLMIQTRYKQQIGKIYGWNLKKFAQWANCIYSKDVIKLLLDDFFKNPKGKEITFRLKDEYSMKDFFKICEMEPAEYTEFTADDFENITVGDYSSASDDEYNLMIKNASFPCSKEEVEKFFELN